MRCSMPPPHFDTPKRRFPKEVPVPLIADLIDSLSHCESAMNLTDLAPPQSRWVSDHSTKSGHCDNGREYAVQSRFSLSKFSSWPNNQAPNRLVTVGCYWAAQRAQRPPADTPRRCSPMQCRATLKGKAKAQAPRQSVACPSRWH